MPVKRVGPVCEIPGCAAPPLPGDRLCSGHWRLERLFTASTKARAADYESVDRFDAAKAAGLAHDHDSPEFSRELREWLA